MAIIRTDEINDKCLSLWHNSVCRKITLTNPNRNGGWVVPKDEYKFLVNESECEDCVEDKEKSRKSAELKEAMQMAKEIIAQRKNNECRKL